MPHGTTNLRSQTMKKLEAFAFSVGMMLTGLLTVATLSPMA